MSQNLRNIKANTISSITEGITTNMNISGNLNPTANVTYNLGNTTHRWKDLFLSNSTIYLGDTTFNSTNVFPFNLVIAPEVLTINVAAPFAGDDISWVWNWQTSTLPYARTTIVNSQQVSVPLYKQGTYQINNFANEQTGSMTQRHGAHLKWIDGAGLDNLVSWAVESGNVSFSDPNINGGASTNVQRINVTVPASITLPTLVAPSLSNYMTVSCVNSGVYTFSGNGDGDNRTLGPLYRGGTYTFHLGSSLSNDPFYFTTDNGTNFTVDGYYGEYTTGVTGSRNNGTTGKTTITIVVDSTAPDVLFYQSSKTSTKRGAIVIKDLAVETNVNGNYILYFQHGGEGHKTPVEIRPIPSMVNQMCVVFDATVGKFVPQDLATYVENTPSFKNKIREVAGTATLIAPNGVAVVPTVLVVEDTTYLPLINNKEGDIAFDSYYDTIYVWQGGAWRNSKPTTFPGANVTGAVANATYSTTSGTAYSVTGSNVVGQVGFAAIANSVSGSNVSGQVGNALVSGTVYTNAQPNITSVGTLSSLSVTGNISSGNANLGNLTTSNYFTGNGSLLTSITGGNVSGQVGNSLIAGTVYTNAQPNITSVGSLTNLDVTGNITIGGNLSVSGTTTIINSTTVSINDINIVLANNATTAAQANGAGITINGASATMNYISSTNAFTFSHKISADGSLLTSLTGGNVTGQVSNSLISGTVYTNAQPNITSVGTLTSLTISGNVSSGNANLGNLTTSNYFTGNGSLLTSLTGANVTGFVPNANVANTAYAVSGGNVTSQVGNSLIAGTVYTNAQPNITSVGSLTSLTSGTITVNANANIAMSGTLSQIAGGNLVSASYLTGTLTTSSQPNVTSVGSLSSLTITSNGNITMSGSASQLSGANLISGSYLTGTLTTASQPNITSVGTLTTLTSGTHTISANANIAMSGSLSQIAGGNLVSASYLTGTLTTASQPNITSVGSLTSLTSGTHTISANANIAMSGTLSQISGANLISGSYLTGTLTTAAQPNITSVGTLTNTTLGSSNSLTGGNLVSASYLTGTLTTASQPNITSVSTSFTGLTLTSNGNVSLSGTGSQISGANLISGSYLTGTLTTASQPNITSVGTLTTLTSGTHTISANANIAMSGSLSQIAGGNLVSASYLTGTLTTAAQPNVTSTGSLTGLTVSNATGVVNFTTTANVTLGNVSNLHISGGSSGQYLKTDGSGGLSFAAVTTADPMHPFLLSGM